MYGIDDIPTESYGVIKFYLLIRGWILLAEFTCCNIWLTRCLKLLLLTDWNFCNCRLHISKIII